MLERTVPRAAAFALAATCCSSPVFAQDAPAGPRAAWPAFVAETGAAWTAWWDDATGTPTAIFGQGMPLADWRGDDLAEARRQADGLLRRWPGLLGLGASDFRERIGGRMGHTWSFTFDQSFRGVPVLDGRVDVRIHGTGRLVSLGSRAWPVPADFSVAPELTAEAATAIAWQALDTAPDGTPQPGHPRAERLVIWTDATAKPGGMVLAWEVPLSAIRADGSGACGRGYVDARSGRFLQFRTDKHECGFHRDHGADACAPVPTTCTVLAWAHTGLSPVAAPVNTPLPGLQVVVPGHGTLVTDANGQFTVDLTGPTTVTVRLDGVHHSVVQGPGAVTQTLTLQPGQNSTFQLASAGSGEQPLAHTTTAYWVHRENEWARSILGASPELAIADGVTPIVNIASSCNAYYAGNSINFYVSGGGCNNTAAASVVAHEWGHGLDDQYGGISQTNGLSEGWGDICSMYLLDDPTIGHDFFVGGGGIRSGNNNRQYPTGSEVHAMGESWMGFAWLFRQNLRTSLGTAAAIAISDEVVIGSIVANATDQATAVLQAYLADDDNGNLLDGTPHYAELTSACQAHSLPYPAQQAGYLQHTALGNTNQQHTPRLVEVDAIPVTGSFVQVRVVYDDGAVHQRDLVPATQANRWRGLLPGMTAPSPLRYHFEALHANSTWFRLPTSGEFQYGTLAERRLHFEDFENGAPGWSHGAVTGSDDWEIAAPTGRSGAGWTDPSMAASGVRCAGTDLQGDGAYAPSSETWLRSPPIDCSGTTIVKLRCRVFLSYDGSTDHLEIRANGTPIWMGAQVPFQANDWSTLEIFAAPANGSPNAVFEFRLRSDALFERGGWNLDDFEVFTPNQSVASPGILRLSPEQASTGTPVALSLATQGPQPFLLAIGFQPGPTPLPGLPTLQVGGPLLTFFAMTDANGSYTTGFPAPGGLPASGSFWYAHALTLDASGHLVASNPGLALFTP